MIPPEWDTWSDAMAKFKLPGFRQWLDTVSEETAQAGANEIVNDLKDRGPYYTGEFEENWVVLAGDKRVPASKPSAFTEREKREAAASGELPFQRRRTPVNIPEGSKDYTIGNVMEYRNIALDLVPGRTPKAGNTAEEDWFVKYTQGGEMTKALERATGIASRNPRVKGFKGKKGQK